MSPWPRAGVILSVGCALLALTVILLGGVAAAEQSADSTDDILDDSEWLFVVELTPDGDGHWELTQELNVTTTQEELAFQDLATDFEDGAHTLETVTAFERAASRVDERTSRSMAIVDHERTATLDTENNTGTLTASFTWEGFARVDGDSLHIDDAIQTRDGIWFDGLASNMVLRISPPEGYAVFDATTSPRDGELRWTGPQEFDESTLVVEFRGDAGTDDGPTNGGNENGNEQAMLFLTTLALVAAAVLLTVAVVYRHRLAALVTDESDEKTPVGTDSSSAETSPRETGAVADETRTEADDALLSDEERVEQLLEANGGRMKQAQIVRETDWSNAKVSQLLSAMEEEGRIDKLRIGRENLISFPDVDVADSDES